MYDSEKYTRRFRIIHEKSWSWHVGWFFCVGPKPETNERRDIYLFVCFARHNFSIGMITEIDQ